MIRMTTILLTAVCSVLFIVGCGSDSPTSQSPANTSATTAQASSIPADLITSEPIDNAGSLTALKQSAKAGDEVAFVAAIGGRANPFIDGRAVMVVSDLELAFCTDGCPVPWDACCALPEDISKHTATVQVVDDQGNPLRVSLAQSFSAGTQIQVSGVIDRIEESATVINAHRVHVMR